MKEEYNELIKEAVFLEEYMRNITIRGREPLGDSWTTTHHCIPFLYLLHFVPCSYIIQTVIMQN